MEDMMSWFGDAKRKRQPRSQGLFPILSAGREKTLASAGHVPPYTLKSWV